MKRSNRLFRRAFIFPWKSFLATSVTVAVFALLFSRIDFYGTMDVLSKISPVCLLVSLVISVFSNIFLPAEEWRLVLRALGSEVPFRTLLFIKFGVAPVKNAVPLKSGELVRAFCLKKISGISFSTGILSILISLIFGLLTLFAVSLAGCLWFSINPYNIGYFCFAGFFCVLLFLVLFRKTVGNEWVLSFLAKFSHRIADGFKRTVFLFSKIRLRTLFMPFFLGIIVKLSELLVFYFIFKGLGVGLPLYTLFIFVPVTMLVSIVPVTFLGMGIREGVIVLLFSGCCSPEIVLGGGVLFSMVDYVFPAVTGVIFTRRLMGRVIVGS